jgi:hypothetical protein
MALKLDLPRAADLWTPQQVNLYNQLPIFLNKQQVKYQRLYDTWSKFLKPQRWEPNKGPLMRGVRKERSPILRGQAIPTPITQIPLKDVIEVREVVNDTQLYRKNFESDLIHFIPSFEDFLQDHVDATNKDMTEKIVVYKDLFYRTAIFHGAPSVYVCGTGLVSTAHWLGQNIALSKSAALLQQLTATATPCTLQTIKKMGTVFYNDIGAVPFSGDVLGEGTDGSGLKQKFCLVVGTELWDSFTDDDTYLLNNKSLNLDIVTGPFTGSLFGRFTTKHERFEMRIDANGAIVAPETIEVGTQVYNTNETIMAPAYVNAPWAVGFIVGWEAYKGMVIGAPPKFFADGNITMEKFAGMDWSGKVYTTRNVLVPSLDAAGATVLDTNKRGEYMQLLADSVMGISPVYRRNILPFIYLRSRIAD